MPDDNLNHFRVCALPECEETFIPTRKTHIYHSRDCSRKASNAKPAKPEIRRVCENLNCNNSFVSKRITQKFCSQSCAEEARNSRRYRSVPGGVTTLDEALEVAHAKDAQQRQRSELKKATALESRIRRYIAALEAGLKAYEPTKFVPVHTKKQAAALPNHEALLFTGDWHTGQRTKIHETGGIYEQDIETTRTQIFKLWDRIERLHGIESSSIHYSKLHITSLGDLTEGDDMRPSQHRQIEDVMTVQVVQAFDLFTWLIRQALQIYEVVEVDLVGGNHDRLGRNRGNAGLGELDYADTTSWLIGEFAKRVFQNEPRVKITNWNTFFGYKLVAGQRLVFEHGSSFRWNANSYGGVPWYSVAQLPRKYAEMLGEADIMAIGHGHRPAILPAGRGWMIVNGALPATSNFEQSSFKSVHRPLQWLVSVHEEHGITSYKPIYLDVPGTVAPGEVWSNPELYAELANRR